MASITRGIRTKTASSVSFSHVGGIFVRYFSADALREASVKSPNGIPQSSRLGGFCDGTVPEHAPDGKPWDVIVVGGGHNGLISAAYLAKAGKRVCVAERRHVVGGAAITEEIVPGFKFSRASYVLSLLRPKIIKDLELERHGLTVFERDPSSFTPTSDGDYLLLGKDMEENKRQIDASTDCTSMLTTKIFEEAKFSKKDAEAYPRYTEMMDELVSFFGPLLDEAPPDPKIAFSSEYSSKEKLESLLALTKLGVRSAKLGKELSTFVEILTAPASKILDRWFESEVLKTTLATDAIIGAKMAPSTPGSGLVLFHHVMGGPFGESGAWYHVKGGMGSVSRAIASAAVEAGVTICTNAPVSQITTGKVNSARGKTKVVANGVLLENGQKVASKIVFSNANPQTTYLSLLPPNSIPLDVEAHFRKAWGCESASVKINLALDKLPSFKCLPNDGPNQDAAMPHHRGTIHFEDRLGMLEAAYLDVANGRASSRPVVEMNLPSSLDDSLAPPGKHVALLFVQYAPYEPVDGPWTEEKKQCFAELVYDVIEEYAPGFKKSIIGQDVLMPPDLEQIFGLPKGNIFHGAMSLDQMLWLRPISGYSRHRSPIDGLYLCGAGTHPGGGVMGAPGRNAAMICLKDAA